jgi:hypothetical protein
MKQTIQITVPTDWSAITLEKYLKLHNDLKSYEGIDAAQTALLFYHLCDLPNDYLMGLDVDTFTKIKGDLEGFMQRTDLPMQKIITIDGKEYGLEPNLGKIAYGAYLDIAKYETFQIDNNWAKVMSILYRPITKRVGDLYEIEKYNGNIDGDKFLGLGMDIHFGALFFFVHLLEELPSFILKSLKDMPGIPPNIKSTLEKSGEAIAQLYS